MSARKPLLRNDGRLCVKVPITVYPSAEDLSDALVEYMAFAGAGRPWPKTKSAVLGIYRTRVLGYGLQQIDDGDLFLYELPARATAEERDELVASLHEKADATVRRLFPELRKDDT